MTNDQYENQFNKGKYLEVLMLILKQNHLYYFHYHTSGSWLGEQTPPDITHTSPSSLNTPHPLHLTVLPPAVPHLPPSHPPPHLP